MNYSPSLSKPAAAAKPAPCCGFPGCPEPAPHQCSRRCETHYYSTKHQKGHWKLHKKLCVAPQMKPAPPLPPPPPSSKVPPRTCGFPGCTKKGQHHCSKCGEFDYSSEKHQEVHWKYHKKICVAPQKKISMPVPPAPPVPLMGTVVEEEEYEDKCVICLVNVPDAQMRPFDHYAVCRDCTRELMTRSQPCPICRKPVSSFEVGVYSGSLGERGLWLTSVRNIRELARNDGFNEYFRKQFNGNEATYLRWKEVFDVLEIEGGKGIYYTVRESLEQQVLRITRSQDLVKLRALAKLCSQEFFNDPSLLMVASKGGV
ncbi:hypothetical protein TrLO_g2659 [Triparma laevis f. longispina]|uniref:RING-type domain-containing protein n=1 Tax=Triparma laevis f. longispina TaxID=1714387 RepID=A0A9W7EEF6_9STRA|nr:hypothetical protein TrLO_g2659 [Triparma laevis f. longispina]